MFCLVAVLVACFGIVGASGVDLGYVENISVAVGMLVGLVWLVALINDTQGSHWRYDRRGWVRWGTPPAIFLAAFIVIGSSVPSIVRFDLSESAMQQTASQTNVSTGYGLRWIGLYEFYDVRVDGPIRFFDLTLPTDSSGLCSFAYAPQQTPAFDNWITTSWSVRSLGQDWWYGCQGTRYGD